MWTLPGGNSLWSRGVEPKFTLAPAMQPVSRGPPNQEAIEMMPTKRTLSRLAVVLSLGLVACTQQEPIEGEEELVLTSATPERVTGVYTRDGVRVRLDTVQTDALTSVVVRADDGEELLRMDRRGDLLISSAFGGRAKVTADLSYLRLSAEMARIPEAERPEFSLEGAVIEEGDPRAFTDLERRAEYALLPWLSRELGIQGFSGKAAPATLGFHVIAVQAARDLGIELPATTTATEQQGYCVDLRSNPYGDDALGMCGPGTSCWDWICGDCCCHDGCKSHDNTCRNCKWYKPWNCFLCASFLSFADGGCGTSCQGNDYGEPSCTGLGGWCSASEQCCDHYPGADEAQAGAVNVVCSTGSRCTYEGECTYNCGGYAGYCWCDSACTYYGDCCADAGPSCGFYY